MFCKKCGSHIVDGAQFCPKCGAEAPAANAGSNAEGLAATGVFGEMETASLSEVGKTSAGLGAAPESADATAAGETIPLASGEEARANAPSAKRPRKPLAIAAAAAVVVVVAVGAAVGLGTKANQEAEASNKAAWALSHTSLITQVVAETPGFDDASTAIPVQITGTDLDGNKVDEVQYLKPGSMEISTLAGSYDVTFPGGYFTGDGKVVKAPDVTQHIEVPEPTKDGEEYEGTIPPQSVDADEPAGAEPANSGEQKPSDSTSEQPNDSSDSSESADSSDASEKSGSSESAASTDASDKSESSESASSADSEDTESAQGADGQQGDSSQSAPVAHAGAQSVEHMSTTRAVITYTEVPALEVTDELLNEIAKWASEDEQSSARAAELQQIAAANHAQAVADEEARKAAEAEQAAVAAQRAVAAENAVVYAESVQNVADQQAAADAAAAAAAAAAAEAAASSAEQDYQGYIDQRQQMAVG